MVFITIVFYHKNNSFYNIFYKNICLFIRFFKCCDSNFESVIQKMQCDRKYVEDLGMNSPSYIQLTDDY